MPIQDLEQRFPITDENGQATDYFMRLLRERGVTAENIEELVIELDEQVQLLASQLVGKADKITQIATGLGLSGGGDLSADRTIILNALLDNLIDVDTSTTPPTDQQALLWDAGSSLWIPGTVASGGGGGGGPTPTIVGSGGASGITTISLPIPTHVADDIIVVALEDQDATTTNPVGWTLLYSTTVAPVSGFQSGLRVFWRRAVDAATPTFAMSTVNHVAAVVAVVRGCKTTGDPFDVTALQAMTSTNTATITYPNLTTLDDGALVMLIGSSGFDVASGPFTPAVPTGGNLTSGAAVAGYYSSANNGGNVRMTTGLLTPAGPIGVATTAAPGSDKVAAVAISFPTAAPVYVEEAPIDGTPYSRQDAGWVAAASGGGGAGPWELVSSTTIAAPTAAVDVIGLAGVTDILVVGHNLTASLSGVRVCRLSVDNGATFFSTSGDYLRIDTASGALANSSAAFTHTTNATTARTITGTILAANLTGFNKFCMTGSDYGTTGGSRIFAASASPVNAIRIENTAGNLTGGTVYVFKKAAAGGAGGGLTLLSEVRGTGASNVLDVTGIPASYKDLVISGQFRSSAVGTPGITIQVNGLATAIYDNQRSFSENAAGGSTQTLAGTSLIGTTAATGSGHTAGMMGSLGMEIFDYLGVAWKNLEFKGRQPNNLTTGNAFLLTGVGQIRTTASIDRLTLTLASGNFDTNSVVRVWGRT